MAPRGRDLQLTAVTGKSSDDSGEEERLLGAHDDEDSLRRIQVRVTGMTCAACSNSVESALRSLDGVATASVALLQNKADVSFNSSLLKDEDIINAIEDAGFEAEILPDSSATRSMPRRTLVGQFTIGGMTCAACVNSVEGILRNLPGVKKAVVALATSLGEVEYDQSLISKEDIVNAIEDAGFEASFVQSNEQDKLLLGISGVAGETDLLLLREILCNLKGVRQFSIDQTTQDLEIHFDPELLGSRKLVDEIESSSSGKLKLFVKNPYARMASKDLEESSNVFRLFTASFFLSVPLLFMRVVCPHIPLLYSLLLRRCGPFQVGDWLKLVLVTIVQFVIGKRFYVAAGRALRNGSTNMDVLIALGTSASYFLLEYLVKGEAYYKNGFDYTKASLTIISCS